MENALFDLPNLVAFEKFILKKATTLKHEFWQRRFYKELQNTDVFLGSLSIKIKSTVLKNTRGKVLGRVALLSADIGLLIDATNFVLALVLLQCSKRTS